MLISNITSIDPLITNSTIQCTRFYTPPAKRRSASIDDMKRYLSRNSPAVLVQPEKESTVEISFVHRSLGTFVCLEHDLAKNVFFSKNCSIFNTCFIYKTKQYHRIDTNLLT